MISAKEIKLKIFLNAVKEFRKAVRHGELNQDETVAKWWKFTGGIFERLVSSGTAKMRFQIFSPDLVVDVWDQTNKGVNFQVLLSGRGHLIGKLKLLDIVGTLIILRILRLP